MKRFLLILVLRKVQMEAEHENMIHDLSKITYKWFTNPKLSIAFSAGLDDSDRAREGVVGRILKIMFHYIVYSFN